MYFIGVWNFSPRGVSQVAPPPAPLAAPMGGDGGWLSKCDFTRAEVPLVMGATDPVRSVAVVIVT